MSFFGKVAASAMIGVVAGAPSALAQTAASPAGVTSQTNAAARSGTGATSPTSAATRTRDQTGAAGPASTPKAELKTSTSGTTERGGK